MQQTILQALLLLSWTQFLSACFWEGMIFGKIGAYIERKAHTLFLPGIGCPICMTPWHGLAAYLIFNINPWAILLAAGANVIIVRWTPQEKE